MATRPRTRAGLALALFTIASLIAASSGDENAPWTFDYGSFPAAAKPFFGTPSVTEVVDGTLRLTDTSYVFAAGAAWFLKPVFVRGFDTSFEINVTSPAGSATPPEGIAFVVQVTAGTTRAYGKDSAGLGYGDPLAGDQGLNNTLAVEFDTHSDSLMNDPPNHHVSIHSAGTAPNSAVENSPAMLCPYFQNIPDIVDKGLYKGRVRYTPRLAWEDPSTPGLMEVWVAGLPNPVLACPVTLESLLDLEAGGTAFVGFTSSTADEGAVQSVAAWSWQFLGVATGNASTAEGKAVSTAAAGESASFVVVTRDQFGNAFPRGGENVEATLDGDALDVTDLANGTYSVSYSKTVAGAYSMEVTVNGEAISGSPFDVTIEAGRPYPPNCYAHGGVLDTPAAAGTAANFTVKAVDAFGNAFDAQEGYEFEVTGNYTSAGGSGSVVYATDGEWRVDLDITRASVYDIQVLYNGTAIGAAGKTTLRAAIVAGPPDGSKSTITTEGLTATAGEPATVAVTAFDAYGNRVLNGDAAISASIQPSEGTSVDAYNFGEGTYVVSWLGETARNYTLDIELTPGGPIAGTPVSVSVTPQDVPSPLKSRVVEHPAGSVVAGDYSLAIIAKDVYGNNLTVAADDILGTFSLRDVATQQSADRQAGAMYLMPAPLHHAGHYNVKVTCNGGTLVDGLFSVTTTPGPADASTSTASGDGIMFGKTEETSSFQVFVCDQYGNGVSDPVTINATLEHESDSHFAVNCSASGDDASTYVCSYNIEKSGEYLLYVDINGSPIQGSPFSVPIAWARAAAAIAASFGAVAFLALCIALSVFGWKKYKLRGYVRL